MRKNRNLIAYILLGIGFLSPTEVSGKDGINMSLYLNPNRDVVYKLSYDGQEVIRESPLGMCVDHRMWGQRVLNVDADTLADGHVMYAVSQTECDTFYVETRLFSDGMALRYHLPTGGQPVCVYGENTTYTFPEETSAWYASGPFQYGWIQAYQDRLTDDIEGELLAPPATFRTRGGIYAALTEANLFDYHGAVLLGTAPNTIQYGFVENRGHLETGRITGIPPSKYQQEVVRNVPWIVAPKEGSKVVTTPWRVLMLAKDLNGLVNNGIIAQVSDKPDKTLFPDGSETDWIKPGRAVFGWLMEGGVKRLSVANHKKYVDGCAELGIESVVVDDGWELWPQTEKDANGRTKWDMLKELVDYAKTKNVNIWVWRPSSPRAGNKTDVGLLDEEERKDFMRRCAEIGVKGLKIDFFHTENLFTVRFMETILRDAAREKLLVIFHGVNKPTGDSFTYPNLLAKEAVRGLECVNAENSWAPGPAWPYHNTVLPFTRWLAGPADYTPLNFRKFCPPSVTFAHQLASIYMFTSPMLIFAADIEDMLNCPARKFIEEVPVTWDETYVLPESGIGDLAAIARRKGDVWYLSVLNGEKARDFSCRLSFLPKGKYQVEMACDADENRRQLEMKSLKLRAGQTFSLKLLSGGGCLLRLSPQK